MAKTSENGAGAGIGGHANGPCVSVVEDTLPAGAACVEQ